MERVPQSDRRSDFCLSMCSMCSLWLPFHSLRSQVRHLLKTAVHSWGT
jgi:hypothetical protein